MVEEPVYYEPTVVSKKCKVQRTLPDGSNALVG